MEKTDLTTIDVRRVHAFFKNIGEPLVAMMPAEDAETVAGGVATSAFADRGDRGWAEVTMYGLDGSSAACTISFAELRAVIVEPIDVAAEIAAMRQREAEASAQRNAASIQRAIGMPPGMAPTQAGKRRGS